MTYDLFVLVSWCSQQCCDQRYFLYIHLKIFTWNSAVDRFDYTVNAENTKKMHTETNIELNELNEFKLTRNLRNRHATTKIFLHFIFFFFSFFVSFTIFRLNLLRVLLCESGQFSSVLFPLRRNFNFFFPNSRFAIFNTSLVRRDCFIRVMWTRIPHIFSIFFFFSNSESNAVRSPWQNIKNSLI